MKKRVVLALTALLSSNLVAADLNLEYKAFYSHLKKLDKPELDQLEFTFGFRYVAGEGLCHIDNVVISTPKQQIPVDVINGQRFRLPTENALKLADAQVWISVQEPTNQCDMSVQLQARPLALSSEYSSESLNNLVTQFDTFFDDMGGFMSFMMPSPQGLQLHFSQQPDIAGLQTSHGSKLDDTTLWLNKDDIETGKTLKFSQLPYQITVWMED